MPTAPLVALPAACAAPLLPPPLAALPPLPPPQQVIPAKKSPKNLQHVERGERGGVSWAGARVGQGSAGQVRGAQHEAGRGRVGQQRGRQVPCRAPGVLHTTVQKEHSLLFGQGQQAPLQLPPAATCGGSAP